MYPKGLSVVTGNGVLVGIVTSTSKFDEALHAVISHSGVEKVEVFPFYDGAHGFYCTIRIFGMSLPVGSYVVCLSFIYT